MSMYRVECHYGHDGVLRVSVGGFIMDVGNQLHFITIDGNILLLISKMDFLFMFIQVKFVCVKGGD